MPSILLIGGWNSYPPIIAAMFNPLREELGDTIKRDKASGVFRKNVVWVDLYASISGLASYFGSN